MKKLISMAMAGVAMSSMAGGAQAAVTFAATSIGTAYSGAPNGDLHKTTTPTVSLSNILITPEIITGKFSDNPSMAVDVFGYCVDIFQWSGTDTFTVKTLNDYLGGDTTKFNLLAALIMAEGKSDKLHDAAVQLAVWEIMNESVSNGYHIEKVGSANQYWVDDIKNQGSGDIAGTANGFLANAVAAGSVSTTGYSFYVLESQSKQDFLYWTYTAPVPEPATWAMMLLGLGAIGYSMRSSRRKTAVSFS